MSVWVYSGRLFQKMSSLKKYAANALAITLLACFTQLVAWADGVSRTVSVGMGPQHVAVSPDGSTVYVADSGESKLSAFDTTNFTVSSVTLAAAPAGLAVTPDGSELWIALSGASEV